MSDIARYRPASTPSGAVMLPADDGEWVRVASAYALVNAQTKTLQARLAEAEGKREEYALQVCLLLDAMKEAGVHIAEKWCWCHPTVENHSADGFIVSVLTGPRPYQKPEMMGSITVSADAALAATSSPDSTPPPRG